MPRSLAAALATLAAASVTFATDARACSICGCDPSVGALGLDRPSRDALRVSLEDRYLFKESGAGSAAEGEKEDRLLARLQWAPLVPLVFQLDLPVFVFKNHFDGAGVQDFSTSGLGDASVSGRWEFLRLGGIRPKHVLAVTGTLKLPTGANGLSIAGQGPDEHLQRGTGTFDGTAGLHYTTGELPWAFFASVSGRRSGTNARGFQYGSALFGSLGARRALLDNSTLLVSLEAQVRVAAKDRGRDVATGAQTIDDDSGGTLGYATASVAWAFLPDFLVRGTVQLPVVTALNGTQAEHPVAYLSMAYDFEL